MAILYMYHGSEVVLKPHPEDKVFTYIKLKAMVGYPIEFVPLPSGKIMIVNEEGKLRGLLKNEKATAYFKKEYPIEKYPHNNELIVGNALICDADELEQE